MIGKPEIVEGLRQTVEKIGQLAGFSGCIYRDGRRW
jgi:hypothetical protein